jgi:hypothetical protein
MPHASQLAAAAHALLRPFAVKVVRRTTTDSEPKPWDRKFATWISEARARRIDPNDLGDAAWADDRLEESLVRHYLPVVHHDATVLELGPGTGRLTRHLIGRCRELILADYSRLVCEWLPGYLDSKGTFRIVHLTGPVLAGVARETATGSAAGGRPQAAAVSSAFTIRTW